MPAKKIFEKINKGFVQKYKTALKDGQKLSDASINRRFSALSKFFDWAEKKGHIVKNPLEKKSTAHSKKGQQQNKTKPSASWYSHYRAFVKYGAIVSTGALVILILNRQITLADLEPENLSQVATETIASYSPWIVQFEGKLFNPNNTPITTTSTVIFSIYETEEGGNSLWSSKEWNLLPDENGVFSAQLGDTSRGDNQISSDLFFQHDQLYIGATVKGKGESKPRLPLSTASNIVNSMHLDGYQAAIEAKPLTVPVISESGELILASKNPKLTSTDGTLKIEGQAITITTPSFSSGDITMAPDGEGTVNMRISASEGNSFNIKNANISSGNLLYGYVGNDTTGYNLLELQSGATPQSQFTVDAKGNTRVGGNLTVTEDTILGTSSLDNIKLQGTVTNTTGTSVLFDDNIKFVGTQSITTSLGDLVLAPAGNIDIQKSIVNTSTNNDGNVYVDDNFKIHGGMYSRSIVNEGSLDSDTITTIGDATFGDSTSDQVTVSGNLTVSGTISGSITGTINPSFTQGSVAFADSSGNLAEDNASFFWDDTNDELGLGTASPGSILHMSDADPTIILDTTTATDTDFWLGVQEDAGGDDDDVFQIGDGTTPGTNPFLSILTGGNVGIGTSDPGFILDVQTDAASSYAGYFFNDGNNANRYGIEVQAGNDDGVTGTTYYLTALDGDGGAVGYVENAAGTFQVTDVSDARTKTNIVDTTLSGLDIINNLRVVDFNRIQNPNGTKHHGFIAQEVEDVYPYMVSQTPDGSLLTIAKEQLIPVLTKAVQEQQQMIENFAKTITANLIETSTLIVKRSATITNTLTAGVIKTTSLVTDSAQVLNILIATRIETDEIISPIVETKEIRMQNVEFRIQNKADETVLSVNDQGALTAKKEVIAPKGSFGELTTDKLESKKVYTEGLETRSATVSGSLNAKNLKANEASISGVLFANDITTKDGKLSSLIERVQSFFDQEKTSALEEQIAQDLTSSKESSFSALLTKLEKAPVYTSDNDIELAEEYNNYNDIYNNYSELFQQELATQYENGLTPSSILVDATLYISGSTIDSGTNTLYLQRFARGSVNIMNGQLVIDVNGDVFINRNLSVKGTIATNSISPLPNGDLTIDLSRPIYENESTTSASFAQLLPEELQKQLNKGKPSRFGKIMIKGTNGENVATIDASGSASFIGDIAAKSGQFDKLIIASNQASPSAQLVSSGVVSNASTGSMVLAAGKTTVVIKSLQITNDSLIYLTPISDTDNKVLYIAKKRASEKTFDGIGYFEVSIDAPIRNDIEFNWWVIN